jgi:hypothetical protein
VVAAAGNVVNVIASYVLIFGRFGAPELGVRGAAMWMLGQEDPKTWAAVDAVKGVK